MLPWLWCRPAAAAPIRPLAWEPPCAADVAVKRKQQQQQQQQRGPLLYWGEIQIQKL